MNELNEEEEVKPIKKEKAVVQSVYKTLLLNEAKVLKTGVAHITAMQKITTIRQGDGEIRQSIQRDTQRISFAAIRRTPRYFMRKWNLWDWFILTEEQKTAYKKLTVNECLSKDKEFGGIV